MYASIDWSGTALPQEKRLTLDLYVPGGVVVAEVEAVDTFFAEWRQRVNRSAHVEFHGHECTENELLYAMEYVLSSVQVVAMLLNKREIAAEMGPEVFSRPGVLPSVAARPVVSRMLQRHALSVLWLDEDIPKGRRKAFDTEVKREARTIHPNLRLETKHRPSDKSNLIQLADMTVYVLQRQERGSFQTKRLREVAANLWRKEGNEIWWGKGNDLRPYF